jgi:hypothetical protein
VDNDQAEAIGEAADASAAEEETALRQELLNQVQDRRPTGQENSGVDSENDPSEDKRRGKKSKQAEGTEFSFPRSKSKRLKELLATGLEKSKAKEIRNKIKELRN